MKKSTIFVFLFFLSIGITAQQSPRERIKAFKIAYITEELNLSSTEAQQFWPIYNSHEEKIEKLRKQERKMIRTIRETMQNSNGINDQTAGEYIDTHLTIKDRKNKAHNELIFTLKKVLSNKKILKLIKAEAEFKKRMLERMKHRRKKGH
ncbi:hypothetical protein ABW636_02160 [Aquimarina sp. 2201CG1-2-11]|uniref:hypothetical protein n=1 Tax=Aquimarina discodermiae TaxID=3231043 RepID=UPI003462EE48